MKCGRVGCRKKATLVAQVAAPKHPTDRLMKSFVCSQEHTPPGFTVTGKVEEA